MNCVIPGGGIRAFGKAIQCLAKIGDELYIEALRKGLSLKTVNSARSAFVSFLFCRSFFNSYSDGVQSSDSWEEDGDRGEGNNEEEGGESTIKCKITIRSCLTVFRALSSLEKTVDYCTLSLNLKLSKLVFIFHCRHGIVKTHNLGFQECEALKAVYTKDLSPNHIKVHSRTLGEVVVNFPSFLEEVTMSADPECVRITNYTEEDSMDTRSTLTEVRLLPAEFDDYQIGVDTSISFCLKELRAMLVFTDSFPQSISLRFETAGRPVVFSVDDSTEFTADLVMATHHDSSSNTATTITTTTHIHTTAITSAARHKRSSAKAIAEKNEAILNGRRRNEEGLTHCDGRNGQTTIEDEWSHPFSRSGVNERGRGRDNHTRQTTQTKQRSPHELTRSVTDCTTGDHTTTNTEGGDSRYHTEAGLVSQRERGEDGMMGEGRLEERREGGFEGEGRGGEDDPLEALFGDENMMDVGEAGEGGWERGERGCEMVGEGNDRESERLVTEQQPATISEPQPSLSADHVVLRSPHPDRITTIITTPHTSPRHLSPVREDGWEGRKEGGTQQDSILHDSGFLPGTPPAKKFKGSSSSLLFGVGLFNSDLSTPVSQSAILAPDSEEEEEEDCN